VKPGDVKIGMKVKAVWKPARERKGDITDIRYFKPAEVPKEQKVKAAEKQNKAGKRTRKGARGGR
jgi:hypothetical protein